MPALLAPAALWALAVLGLPVAIHLWRRPPRTIPLGSLRFLREHSPRRWRNVRWRERFLLAVRLGLLLTLVVLLACPIWRRPSATRPQRWILLDPAAAVKGPALERLRALQAAGFETRWLSPGFPENNPSSNVKSTASVDLWSLLREADAMLPEGSTLAVFTPGRLASLHGIRPGLSSKIEWVATADTANPSPYTWLQSAREAPAGGQHPSVSIGTTDADTVTFSTAPPPAWKLESRPDATRLVDPAGNPHPWTTVDALPSLKVLILHDPDRTEDARLLAAAVQAAVEQRVVKLDLNVVVTDPGASTPSDTNWTFWLSASAPPAFILDRKTQLVTDARHAEEAIDGWIASQTDVPVEGFLPAGVRLWRRGAAPAGAVIWTDEHGTPLLTRRETEQGSRWQFASRFHPAWNDLPRTSALPSFLRGLLLPAPSLPEDDLRLDPLQGRPAVSGLAVTPLRLPDGEAVDLHGPLWLLAALLFCVERVLSQARRPFHPAGRSLESVTVSPR